ncbi:MAG: hypothetical protein KGN16_10365 [Burkholderiales bacterium]|nr:hypothetical protein [Burkholderiales bacterium]
MTVSMNFGNGFTGNYTIPAPSGAIVALVNGVGQVAPADVPVALQGGATILPGSNWPAVRVYHMTLPTIGNWAGAASVLTPDGTVLPVTAGNLLVPIAWLNWARGYGFTATPGWGCEGI